MHQPGTCPKPSKEQFDHAARASFQTREAAAGPLQQRPASDFYHGGLDFVCRGGGRPAAAAARPCLVRLRVPNLPALDEQDEI